MAVGSSGAIAITRSMLQGRGEAAFFGLSPHPPSNTVLWHPRGRGEERILKLHTGSAMHVPKALWLWAQGGLGAVQIVPVSPSCHPMMGDLEEALIFGSAAAARLNSAPILGI